jgi:spore coat polysaccharide biosynthesis protein SpsF
MEEGKVMSDTLHTVAIVQARMSSSRLPGKVLKEINGKPMIAHVVERTRRAKCVDYVAVATTTDAADDAVERWCKESQTACYRGSMFDVLDRYYQAARLYAADIIVRVTADCPVIDPQVIDDTVTAFHAHNADFAANRLPPPWGRTFPIGLDTEVCRFSALERAWLEATEAHEREHVMPYLYDTPGRFIVYQLKHFSGLRRSAMDSGYTGRPEIYPRGLCLAAGKREFHVAGCADSNNRLTRN